MVTALLVYFVCWPHSCHLFVYVPSHLLQMKTKRLASFIVWQIWDADKHKFLKLVCTLISRCFPLTPILIPLPQSKLYKHRSGISVKGEFSVNVRLPDNCGSLMGCGSSFVMKFISIVASRWKCGCGSLFAPNVLLQYVFILRSLTWLSRHLKRNECTLY